MIGRFLRPSARDLSSYYAQPSVARARADTAAVTVLATYTVPADMILLLQNWYLDFIAGAAQTVTSQGLYLADSTTALSWLYADVPAAPPNRLIASRAVNELWIPPSTVLTAQGSFSAGANPNTVIFDRVGILIPRGNYPAI